MTTTLRSARICALLLASAILAGCAQTNSASAGATMASGPPSAIPGVPRCVGNANADCYGGGP